MKADGNSLGQAQPLATPVVVMIFNRPEATARVLAEIRKARPSRLFVIADGPRPGHDRDGPLCRETRQVIANGVDWPCQLKTDYAETNLGCGRRIATGIDRVFAQVDEAIFLEDDCLPTPEFFRFCSELLARYRENPQVGQVSGCTFVGPQVHRETSYLFSRYGPVWGWASWRRAWQGYDFAMNRWPEIEASSEWRQTIPSAAERALRSRVYAEVRTGRLNTWDYQWGFAKLSRRQLSAVPCVNLIENIGFGAGATHTAVASGDLQRGVMSFPLVHPKVTRDDAYDRAFSRKIAPTVVDRGLGRLRRLIGS